MISNNICSQKILKLKIKIKEHKWHIYDINGRVHFFNKAEAQQALIPHVGLKLVLNMFLNIMKYNKTEMQNKKT